VLAVGASVSLALWLTLPEADDTLYEMTVSKSYVRMLQRFGGKASVVFDEMTRWFAGLWEGKTLALTLLALSVLIAAVLALCGKASR
jgi:hypothetical protein